MNDTADTLRQEAIETENEIQDTHPEPLSDVLTADQVARLFHLNRKTVYAAFKAGEIPGRRIRGAIRFHRDRLLQWLAEGQERASRSPRGAR